MSFANHLSVARLPQAGALYLAATVTYAVGCCYSKKDAMPEFARLRLANPARDVRMKNVWI
jgi:hypothetical protein